MLSARLSSQPRGASLPSLQASAVGIEPHDRPCEAIDPAAREPRPSAHARPIADDKAMLRAAVELTRDLAEARAGDLLARHAAARRCSAMPALAGAILLRQPVGWRSPSGVVAALALYRALLFIHELTHIHRDALPGFRLGWNLLVGIPMLTPSFMYENVHTLHHARTRYGTARGSRISAARADEAVVAAAVRADRAAAPVGAADPLGGAGAAGRGDPAAAPRWCGSGSRRCRSIPTFRRRPAEGEFARQVFWQEAGRIGCGRGADRQRLRAGAGGRC